jgi:Na+/proline symporter/nitrogen-specific signal transduction histidine kinase
MFSTVALAGLALAYLLLLFAIAYAADRRAEAGRSVIGHAAVYALAMGVYCTAWTYFGSVGRAASSGLWFLPIYLGPTLAMVLASIVLRKMVRVARTQRITSIADFIASRHGKSRLLAALVTLIAIVGIVPYIALQLKAIAAGIAVLSADENAYGRMWWRDSTLLIALLLAGFTMAFGTRHLDSSERHEGLVAAIAFESLVKLLAFVAVGVFVTWGVFSGPADLFGQAAQRADLQRLFVLDTRGAAGSNGGASWFTLTLLAMLSLWCLPRQFQIMVVENVDERHVSTAAWAFPLYLLAINVFVLPIALAGMLKLGDGGAGAEAYVLTLPMAFDAPWLAAAAFIGGLSAATGMVIVETIAVSTMVCNDLVLPLLLPPLLHSRHLHLRDWPRWTLWIRRAAIVSVMLLGYAYFRIAGEAYALVSIGLISFAAVAQFAPALLGGLFWKGGTRAGALAGLAIGFALWAYTLMLPSIARSGWLAQDLLLHGPWAIAWLRPEQLFGLTGLDNLTHAMFWSLGANLAAYVGVSLWAAPAAREASQALLFVDAMQGGPGAPVFWRGQASVQGLQQLAARFLGAARTQRLFADHAGERADPQLVQRIETELAAAIGSASARTMVASVAQEEALSTDDVMHIVEEASNLRAANEQLQSLDKLKDDFISSVSHELRTPLTAIRALAELMVDDEAMDASQRQHFLALIVAETQRLSRLVNQVLDLAKLESGHAQWRSEAVDLAALIDQAVQTTGELFRERGATVTLDVQQPLPRPHADADRLMQVLVNLLSNAAKFVPAGQGEVTIRARAYPGRVQLEVQDNGPGIPSAQREQVFERFRQADSGSKQPAGTGLGLPISRRIVEHLGGTLSLADMPGQGACFVVELPIDKDTR